MKELLLIESVADLGRRGDRVTVKDGYARNYLIPFGLGIPATRENAALVERKRAAWLAEEARKIGELRELASHLARLDLTIVEKASAEGHLYGSVTEKAITARIAAKGIELDARVVRLEHPLKDVGDYEVVLRLHEEVQVSIPVRVRMEGREDWVPGKAAPAAAAPAAADPAAADPVEEAPGSGVAGEAEPLGGS